MLKRSASAASPTITTFSRPRLASEGYRPISRRHPTWDWPTGHVDRSRAVRSDPVADNTVLALGIASTYGAPIIEHDALTLLTDIGIEGDRHAGEHRAVSIVCTGELARAAADLGIEQIDGLRTRRNIVVDLDELPRTHGAEFSIGDVRLAVWRDCAPCNLMDETFGDGASTALRQRAGITASVVQGGTVRVGDALSFS